MTSLAGKPPGSDTELLLLLLRVTAVMMAMSWQAAANRIISAAAV